MPRLCILFRRQNTTASIAAMALIPCLHLQPLRLSTTITPLTAPRLTLQLPPRRLQHPHHPGINTRRNNHHRRVLLRRYLRMVLHLAQAQAEGRSGVFAARFGELEGGFDEAGGAHAMGFGDAAHGADHGGIDADVFQFDSGDEDPGWGGWLALVLEYFSWVV